MAKVLELGQTIDTCTLSNFAGGWSQLWDTIHHHSRASLEWWLLFANTFGTTFLELNPIYEVSLDQCVLNSLGQELDKSLLPRPKGVHLIVEVGGQLDTQAVQKIVSIRKISRLDLHQSSLDAPSLRAVRQSIEYGSLRGLEQLCLPKRGPAELKPLLDRPWPRSLQYIESPRKVAGYARANRNSPRYAIHFKVNVKGSSSACRSHAYRVNG